MSNTNVYTFCDKINGSATSLTFVNKAIGRIKRAEKRLDAAVTNRENTGTNMSKPPFHYTNRQQKTYYVRAVPTKKGKLRYYLTQTPEAADLITEIPEGYEVVEYPFEGKVVIRKQVPIYTTPEEKEIVRQAMKVHSPVKDFIITAERGGIAIHISQFSHYWEPKYLSAEEAREIYGDNIHRWKTYDWILTFELLDKEARKFQVIRKASIKYDAVAIDEGTDLKVLAEKYCYHIGRESLLNFWIPGEDW